MRHRGAWTSEAVGSASERVAVSGVRELLVCLIARLDGSAAAGGRGDAMKAPSAPK